MNRIRETAVGSGLLTRAVSVWLAIRARRPPPDSPEPEPKPCNQLR